MMVKLGIFSTLILLVSNSVIASNIGSVHVFHNDATPVIMDSDLHYEVELSVHNMDIREKTNKRLNDLVKSKLKRGYRDSLKESYSEAFNQVLNGPEWVSLYQGYTKYAKNTEYAIRFKIKKVPAVLINNKSIIYGVTSLKEAIDIYNRNEGIK